MGNIFGDIAVNIGLTGFGLSPTFMRLARAGRFEDIRVLADHVRSLTPANDNIPTDEMGVDTVIEVRPTPNEIARASIKIKDGKPDSDGEIGLRFSSAGKLLEWRQADENGIPVLDKDGNERWLPAYERYRQSKGSRRKSIKSIVRTKADHAKSVLSLHSSGTFPQAIAPDTRYPSEGCERLDAAHKGFVRAGIKSKNRELLESLGVDGSRTLEQCAEANPQASVTRGRDAIAYGAEFMSGKTDRSGTATEGSFVGAPDAAEHAMASALDATAVAGTVGPFLGMALSGKTAKEVAADMGWSGKSGERRAVREIDAAIEILKKAA